MPAKTRPRCNLAGCNRLATPGHLNCRSHLNEATGDAVQILNWPERAGSYRGIFGPTLSRLMREASEDTNVDDEIGALRVVLARVMIEEQDPIRLAQAVARITTASVLAAKARRLINGEMADTLTEALTQVLLELHGTE